MIVLTKRGWYRCNGPCIEQWGSFHAVERTRTVTVDTPTEHFKMVDHVVYYTVRPHKPHHLNAMPKYPDRMG
jgi:hypothetical protein